MNNTISFNYIPLTFRKSDALRLLNEFQIECNLPKLNEVTLVGFPSTIESPVRSIEITKPTKQHIYSFKFISGNIPINPDTNLPDKVPFFRKHTSWLTVIPAVWNEFKDSLTKSEQNKNKTEMDILIDGYSY